VLNTLGHAAGALIFAHFLALAVWNRPLSHLRASSLSILAASLAFLWNLASFVVLASSPANGNLTRAIAGLGFCVLSLLPAVLLNLCLLNRFPLLVRCGYALSAVAISAHLVELFRGVVLYHQVGLAVITVGFGLLTVASVLTVLWSGEDRPRLLGSRLFAVMSLFLFAISFVHFSEGQSHGAWSTELAFHHGGIPLALFILLQDYRFVILDAFVRFLANGLLAGIFAVVITSASSSLSDVGRTMVTAVLLATFGATRGHVQRLLGRMVFRQGDCDRVIRDLRHIAADAVDEESFVKEATQRLAAFMQAKVILIPRTTKDISSDPAAPTLVTDLQDYRELQNNGVEVVIPIRLAQSATQCILLGERCGGRRYLSEDLQQLTRIASCISEQADQLRETEMKRLVSQAELIALQSQINPHFLFNALNAIYGTIPREISGARRMLLNLADVFRYFLQSDKTYIPLEEELRIVKAYLEIEELRFADKLRVVIDVGEGTRRTPIPILSLQPLVENAVKHGIAACPCGGEIRIETVRQDGGVRIRVHDTGPGFREPERPKSREHAGVGLANVSRRLQLCYGPAATLEISSSAGNTTVGFYARTDREPAH